MGKPEANFQKKFIDKLKKEGFKCIRAKASGNVNKGVPDYAVFYGGFWAWLEFKRAEDATVQPGQTENIRWALDNSYGAFVFPEVGDFVLNTLRYYKFVEDNR